MKLGRRNPWKKLALAGCLLAVSAPLWAQGAVDPCLGGQKQEQKPAATDSAKDFHMDKEQAKELFRCVDAITQFASDDTKYPILHKVKYKLATRESVQSYLMKKFDEDKSSQKMQQSELVLKKFGLLDHDFQLRPFLVSLLTEQIAGFYDDKTRTMNLLDWIQPDEQKPVMAHELTHALQDQHVGLEKWENQTLTTTSHNVDEDNAHLATDEVDDARDAVLEGQAMAVFVDYSLKPSGRSLLTAPEVIANLKDALGDTTGSPVMARAPLLLQETLVFPYREGMGFTAAILLAKGPQRAFAGVLDNPPGSSFEIMHPDAYLAQIPVPVLHLADIHPLIDKEYLPYDVGVMGALDVHILTELFGGEPASEALTPAWDGGLYYAAQRRSATDEEKKTTASLALIYYSRWKNADSARSFMRVYQDALPRKYTAIREKQIPPETDDTSDRIEAAYSTNEGDVLMVQDGRGVFIAEGFDMPLARKLYTRITALQSDAPMQTAGNQRQDGAASELTGPLTQWMGSLGMMKFAMAPAR
jgi:hypothetical protein